MSGPAANVRHLHAGNSGPHSHDYEHATSPRPTAAESVSWSDDGRTSDREPATFDLTGVSTREGSPRDFRYEGCVHTESGDRCLHMDAWCEQQTHAPTCPWIMAAVDREARERPYADAEAPSLGRAQGFSYPEAERRNFSDDPRDHEPDAGNVPTAPCDTLTTDGGELAPCGLPVVAFVSGVGYFHSTRYDLDHAPTVRGRSKPSESEVMAARRAYGLPILPTTPTRDELVRALVVAHDALAALPAGYGATIAAETLADAAAAMRAAADVLARIPEREVPRP